MTPMTLDGSFAWLHLPADLQSGMGVVLCPALKSDDLNSYAALRILADKLAAQGFAVMRLQYTHTGDSAEIDSTSYWETWQADVHRAADWLKANCGVTRLAMCGLRFGALMAAAVAAKRRDVVAMALFAPVLRGKSFMRQIKADSYWQLGVQFRSCDVKALSGIDLGCLLPPEDCRTLMLPQSDTSAAFVDCLAKWKAARRGVTVQSFEPLRAMLRPTFANHEAAPDYATVIGWLNEVDRGTPRNQVARPAVPPASVRSNAWTERPIAFGEDRQLFGILCEPNYDAPGATAVLIGNSSADPHCSSNAVSLARHLAVQGTASLRFDFAGVGDSAGAAGSGTHVFSVDRAGDFSAAIDALQNLGYRRFATQGLCSGAYHAYRAAVTDPRVGWALMINIPFFEWVAGTKVEDLVFHDRTAAQLWQEMKTARFWMNNWRKVCERDPRLLLNRFAGLKRRLGRVPGFKPVRRAGTKEGVQLLFMISEGDISGKVISRYYGGYPPANVVVRLIDGLDHSMHRPEMSAVVAHHMVEFTRAPVPADETPVNRAHASSADDTAGIEADFHTVTPFIAPKEQRDRESMIQLR